MTAEGLTATSNTATLGPHPAHRAGKAANVTLIISTLYLPETAANLRYQHAPLRSICAGQTKYSVITGAVR